MACGKPMSVVVIIHRSIYAGWLRLASRGSRGMSSAFLEPRPPIPLLAFPKITSAGKVETALVNSFATAVVDVSEAEKRIKQVLHAKFPGAVEIEVNDVSGKYDTIIAVVGRSSIISGCAST